MDELSIRAVKLFPELFKDAWKHDEGGWLGWDIGCNKCGVVIKRNTKPNHLEGTLVKTEQHDKPCTVPDPIDINWDNAMMLRDVAIAKTNTGDFMRACMTTLLSYPEYSGADKAYSQKELKQMTTYYFAVHATPADYILAACKAREKENG